MIFTAAKDLESIQKHLSEDCHNLSSWFRDDELVHKVAGNSFQYFSRLRV